MNKVASSKRPDFANIIDDLYAGTLDDAAWNRGILAIADSVRASGALLLGFNPTSGALLRYENHRLDPQITVDYQKHWTYEDIRRDFFLPFPTCTPVTELMLPMPDRWRRSAILNEFLTPIDVPHFMPAWLHKTSNKAVTLSLQGTRKRGPFNAQDLNTYRSVLPHIARALQIRDQLEQLRVRAQTLASSLNPLSFGVAVLDTDGKLLEANAFLSEVLGQACGIIRLPDGALHIRGPDAADFNRWITTGAPPSKQHGFMRIPRAHAPPLSVMLVPLPPRTTSWIGGDPRWLLFVFDPSRHVAPSAAIIVRDLGLTPREGDLAALIAASYTLQEAAARLQVTENTARTQLKSIYRKTALSSQPALVARIMRGPVGSLLGPTVG